MPPEATDRPRRPRLLRPGYLLPIASTSTSVGLNLSLPSTPTLIGELGGYFSMSGTLQGKSRVDNAGAGVDNARSDSTVREVPRRRRGSDSVSTTSSSSPPGAAGILAALSSSNESPQKPHRAPPPYLAQLARTAPPTTAPTHLAMPPTPPMSESSPPRRGYETPVSRGSVSTFASGTYDNETPTSTYSTSTYTAAPASVVPPALSNVSVSAESAQPIFSNPAPSSSSASSFSSRRGVPNSRSLPRLSQPGVQRSSVGFMPTRAAPSSASTSSSGGNVYMPRSESASERLSGMLMDSRQSSSTATPPTTDRRTRTMSGASTRSIPPPQPGPPARLVQTAPPSVLVPMGSDRPTVAVSLKEPDLPEMGARLSPPMRGPRRSSGSSSAGAKVRDEDDENANHSEGARAQATEDTRVKQSRTPSSSTPTSSILSTSPRQANTPSQPSASSKPPTQPLKTHTSHLMPDPIQRASSASPGSESSERYTSAASSAGSVVYRTPPGSPAPSPAASAVAPSPKRPTPCRARSRKDSDRDEKAWLPTGVDVTDGEIELNDVDAPSSSSATGSSTALETPLTNSKLAEGINESERSCVDCAVQTDYEPPYQPRKRPASIHAVDLNTEARKASLSSGPEVLPLSRRRVELELLWDLAPAPSMWDYLPGARLVPTWSLRAAGGKSGVREIEDEGGVIWWVVGRVPIVGGALREWF